MNGKDKCKILKEIRKQIAENNNIEWVTSECKHKGECTGTCPKCESEVRKLERELNIRRNLGLAVSVVGISTLCLTAFTGCSSILPTGGQVAGNMSVEVLDGEVEYIPDDDIIEADASGDAPCTEEDCTEDSDGSDETINAEETTAEYQFA